MNTHRTNSKNMLSRWTHLFGSTFAIFLMMQAVTFSQTTVNLGTAANFGVLAQAAISGTASITGNVGTLSGTIDGTIIATGYTIYPVNDLIVQAANAALNTAYLNAAGQSVTNTPEAVVS